MTFNRNIMVVGTSYQNIPTYVHQLPAAGEGQCQTLTNIGNFHHTTVSNQMTQPCFWLDWQTIYRQETKKNGEHKEKENQNKPNGEDRRENKYWKRKVLLGTKWALRSFPLWD